jgi:hypothetical protein
LIVSFYKSSMKVMYIKNVLTNPSIELKQLESIDFEIMSITT